MTSLDPDDVASWHYILPEDLIAARPAPERDDARLMVVRRRTGRIEHRQIRDLPDLLTSGDRLVFNNTRVLPARLFGRRTNTGGKWEGLYLGVADDLWVITGQTRGRLTAGESLTISPASSVAEDAPTLRLDLLHRQEDGTWLVRPDADESPDVLLQRFGTLPLPPYIGRQVADEEDQDRYQTVFASQSGAIAAPTAGLHFTPELLQACAAMGIEQTEVTLHVGIGTFRPVTTDRLSAHQMHSEWCEVSPEAADQINASRNAGGSIVAVGTTSVRTLESLAANAEARLEAGCRDTDLFIRPGYDFRVVDRLLTNFHLPGSTLIVLVAALAGYDLTMEAYRKAVEARYRFYSYGDAMLIL